MLSGHSTALVESANRKGADVKKKRFSEEQIIAVLKEAEAGAKVLDLCPSTISDATFYNWKAK